MKNVYMTPVAELNVLQSADVITLSVYESAVDADKADKLSWNDLMGA